MITEKQVFDALPKSGFLKSYVEWATPQLEANAAFHVACGLALLAQSAPRELCFPGALPTPANLYLMLVGPSSVSCKTRSMMLAQGVLDEALPDRVMMRPGSPEACLDALKGGPQIIFYDEFGAFLQSTSMGQLAPLRMVLTDLYDCGQHVGRNLVKRKDREEQREVPYPRLSVLGGVTPGLLETFTTDVDWIDGFLGRFFTVYASSERRLLADTSTPAVDDGERAHLVTMLKEYAVEFDDLFHVPPRPCSGFTGEGCRLWNEWTGVLRSRAEQGESSIEAAIHRAVGHALKVAILLSWDIGNARSGDPWRLEPDIVTAAIDLTELHVLSVEEIAEGLAIDRDMKDERKMYRAIGDEPIEYGKALRLSHLVKKRGDEMIASLLEKKMVVKVESGDVFSPLCYRRIRESNLVPFVRKKSG